MSNHSLLALSLVFAVACDTGASSWDDDTGWMDSRMGVAPEVEGRGWRVGYEVPTSNRGAEFFGNRDLAVAMADVVCSFSPDGYLLSDRDVVLDVQEEVVDADGVVVVVVDSESDRIGTMYGDGPSQVVHQVPGLLDGRVDRTGELVVLAQDPEHGCAVAFHDAGTRYLVRVPVETCADRRGFDVDPVSQTAFVGTREGVFQVTRDGAKLLPVKGDLVAWDRPLQQLYVATEGVPSLLAIAGQDVRWTAETRLPMRRLRALGAQGRAVALTSDAHGGEVWFFDGETGAATPGPSSSEPMEDISVSASGTDLAVWTQWGVTVLHAQR